MPTLSWIGKEKVVNHHLEVPYKVLQHKYTFKADPNDTPNGNMIIHGDNLEALKALLPEYEGKVKCIYIDPPYNTGNEGWVYNDNVNHPKIQKWLGEVVGKQEEDFTRHDKWLCMMYPRLRLLQRLLSEDGAIFISIDDNEQANLKLMCDEIFGANHYVGHITWFKKRKGSFLSKKLVSLTEYIVCYTKSQDISLFGGIPNNNESQPIVKRTNGKKVLHVRGGIVKTKLNDGVYPIGIYGEGTSSSKLLTEAIVEGGTIINDFDIEAPFTWSQRMFDEEVANGTEILINTISFQIRVVRRNNSSFKAMPSFLDGRELGATNEDAYEMLKTIFGEERMFDFSKPVNLITSLIDASTHFDNNAIVLDSFAGSGTTAHAVLNLNKKDGGNRRFILVEMEDYADTITAERVKKVMNGYADTEGTGGSFDFYELGDTLFNADGTLNEAVGEDRIREYVYYTETKQHLSRKREKSNPYLLDTWNGVGYYFYYEQGRETTLTYDKLSIIKEKAERYIVYADTCTLDKDYMNEKSIIFKKIPRDIQKF